MTYDHDNIFAQILRGEAPYAHVDENDSALAIMDAYPEHEGHCLVLAKQHAVTLFDLSPDILQGMILLTQKVAIAVREVFPTCGVVMMQLNQKEAGQTVMHAHIHIIPRRLDLSPHVNSHHHIENKKSLEELEKTAKQIRKFL